MEDEEPLMVISIADNETGRYISIPVMEPTWPEAVTSFIDGLTGCGYYIDKLAFSRMLEDYENYAEK